MAKKFVAPERFWETMGITPKRLEIGGKETQEERAQFIEYVLKRQSQKKGQLKNQHFSTFSTFNFNQI